MKQILIVGVGGFIARALKAGFEREGLGVIGTSRTQLPGALSLDLTDPLSIERLVLPVNRLHGIVFAQGIKPSRNLKEASYEHFLQMLAVNLIGPSLLLKKLLPLCERDAAVVFFSSVAVRKGSYDPSYAAAKAGIAGLIQSLQNEFPQQRFNAIALGLVEDSPVYEGMSHEFRDRHRSRMHGQTLISVDNIVTLARELVTNKNISRSVLPLDGGYA